MTSSKTNDVLYIYPVVFVKLWLPFDSNGFKFDKAENEVTPHTMGLEFCQG
jgi:hypothetical protein